MYLNILHDNLLCATNAAARAAAAAVSSVACEREHFARIIAGADGVCVLSARDIRAYERLSIGVVYAAHSCMPWPRRYWSRYE